jgi:PAP2 superfamily
MPELCLTSAQRVAVRQLFGPGHLVLAITGLFVVLTLAGHTQTRFSSITQFADNVMFNSLCLGIVLCYATLPLRRGEARVVAALALVAEGVRMFCHPAWWDFWMRLQGLGYGAGVVAFGGIIVRRLRAQADDERLWASGMLYLSLAMFLFPNISTWLHQLVIRATPLIYDAYGYKVDGALGFQPSAVVTRFVHAHPTLHLWVFLTYNELPLFMIAAVLISLKWPEACYRRLMLHMIGIGLVGMLCYCVFPMKGEDLVLGKLFPDGPLPELALAPIADSTDATRNSYPSLHLGWMLSCYFGVRRVHPWVRRTGLTLVGLMVLATLNVAHYAIDLVASFPYVVTFLGLLSALEPSRRRVGLQAALGAAAMLAVFTGLVLHAPLLLADHPLFLLGMCTAVVSGSVWLERRLSASFVPAASHAETEPAAEGSAPERLAG